MNVTSVDVIGPYLKRENMPKKVIASVCVLGALLTVGYIIALEYIASNNSQDPSGERNQNLYNRIKPSKD